MHTVPVWTLYGDGTLIFQTDPSDNLWRTQLSPGPIQHILDVIINQDHFYATSEQRYSSITHGSDDFELLLMVDINGQYKEVTLAGEPPTRGAIDIQTMQVFAIEQFLLAYHPLHVERPVLLPVPILLTRNRALQPFLFEIEEQQQGSTSCQEDSIVP